MSEAREGLGVEEGIRSPLDLPVGWLNLQLYAENGRSRIVDATWEGPPIVVLNQRDLDLVPHWAKVGDDLVQIGQYVLRRTATFDVAGNGYFWTRVGEGELYWWRWRFCAFLANVSYKVRKTWRVWKGVL